MSDQAARDRVIERIAESIDWQPTCLPGDERRTIVRQVLDMAEHPRALAAAPTADVAALRVRLDEALSSYYGPLTQTAIDDITAKTFGVPR